jgi:hypothetical protein
MTGKEFKELPEIVVDDDYEGLLSSYIEPDAWRKMMFHKTFNLVNTKAKLADDVEKASTKNHRQ